MQDYLITDNLINKTIFLNWLWKQDFSFFSYFQFLKIFKLFQTKEEYF